MPAPFPPREPDPPEVVFPDPEDADENGIVAVGEDYSASTLLLAYRSGIFPWPHKKLLPWFSPDPRAIFPIDKPPRWARSLRRTLKTHPYGITLDTAFTEVMKGCADARPGHTWISAKMIAAYSELHERGFAHSVEVWEGQSLVGGIYGVTVGRTFAGESMFHRVTDASKIAFAALAYSLRESGYELFDVQVLNPHLESLGCIELERSEFLDAHRASVAKGPHPLQLVRSLKKSAS